MHDCLLMTSALATFHRHISVEHKQWALMNVPHLSKLTVEDRSHAYGGGLLKYGIGAFATLLRPLAFGEPMTASLSAFMVCPTRDAMAFSASVISAPFWVVGI